MVTSTAVEIGKAPGYRRIATEEAWAPPELIDLCRRELADEAIDDPGFHSLWGFFGGPSERANLMVDRIQNLGERRLADMDATGIDMQVVSLTSPGVQIFDAATEEVKLQDALPMSDADKRKFFQSNAERLFSLK